MNGRVGGNRGGCEGGVVVDDGALPGAILLSFETLGGVGTPTELLRDPSNTDQVLHQAIAVVVGVGVVLGLGGRG